MPELPEVEVVRAGLEPYVKGATFEQVDVFHPRAARGNDANLEHALIGRKVSAVSRRGKFMWLELGQPKPDTLFIHLGMSGQLRVGDVVSPHERIRANLSNSVTLSFIDQRTFGYWKLGELDNIAHIARDPFESDFDREKVAREIRRRRSPIKSVLLNQEIVSGIGNIYADEALWAALIHPRRLATTLSHDEALVLLDSARDVMAQALQEGGTSFDALYVNVNGESGYFERGLHAYGRTGLPCTRCGTLLVRESISNRSSHWCPRCQK